MLIWIYCFAAVLLAAGVLFVINTIRIRRIALDRKGEGFDDFIECFDRSNINKQILVVIYDYFQAWNSGMVTCFPVRADDRIATIYGIIDEDVEFTMIELLELCKRIPPKDESCPIIIVTVRDIVTYIDSCPHVV